MQIGSRPRSGLRSGGIYTGIWILLTVFSLAYLAYLGGDRNGFTENQQVDTTPKLLAKVAQESDELFLRVNRNREIAFQAQKDILALEQTVSDLSTRLDNVEAETTKIGERLGKKRIENGNLAPSMPSDNTKMEIEAIPGRIDTTGSLPSNHNRNFNGHLHPDQSNSIKSEYKSEVSVQLKPLPSSGFGDHSEELPQIRLAEGTGQHSTPQTLFGIHLSSANTIEELQKSWEELRRRYPEELENLQVRYKIEDAADGRPYQLVAGPFSNLLNAVEICAKINRSLDSCGETLFNGEPLPDPNKSS